MKINKYLLMSLIFSIFGCFHFVGGKCQYEELIGKAVIKSIDNTSCIADFYPKQEVWPEWNVKKNIYNIEGKCFSNLIVGKKYPAIYKKSKSNTGCKPYDLNIYDNNIIKSNPKLSKKFNHN